jgi:hypothetical protein
MVVNRAAKFRAHWSILATAAEGPDSDSDDTAPATVATGAQHGRKWSREATRQHARCHVGRSDASEREYER